jgi:hypothetical protein
MLRFEEADLHFPKTGDEFYSVNRAGEILNTYRRFPNPLVKMHRRDGLPLKSYLAGYRYGQIWRAAWNEGSPPHSDPTRIIVDGGQRDFEPPPGNSHAQAELDALAGLLWGSETRDLLDYICGREWSCRRYAILRQLDREAVKDRLYEALAKFAKHLDGRSRRS